MIGFLLITAFTVSIDSFVCGFSLSLSNGKKLPILVCICLTVFLMCLLTNYAAPVLEGVLGDKTACLGGIILIVIGVFNLIKKDKITIDSSNVISESLLTGFAVGLDGAAANLSLSLMGINQFYVPLLIAVMHAFMIYLGILFANNPFTKKFEWIGGFAPFILIFLGAYKLLGFFA